MTKSGGAATVFQGACRNPERMSPHTRKGKSTSCTLPMARSRGAFRLRSRKMSATQTNAAPMVMGGRTPLLMRATTSPAITPHIMPSTSMM